MWYWKGFALGLTGRRPAVWFMDWLIGWAAIAEGVVIVLSFGVVRPSFVFRAALWKLRIDCGKEST